MKHALWLGAALAVCHLTAGCVRPANRAVADTARGTRIVVEDGTGAILGDGVLPGKASALTTRRVAGDGVEIVTAFSSREETRAFRSELNDILAALGEPRLSSRDLRHAMSRRQLTCHEAMYKSGGDFVGVALRRCGEALVFGLSPWSRETPLSEQIGFLREEDLGEPFDYGARGVLPQTHADPAPRRRASPRGPAAPRPVSWDELLPYLEAAVTLDDLGGGEMTTKTCVGNLGTLMEEDPDLGEAVVRALRGFQLSGEMGRRFVYPHRKDADFPKQVFAEPGIREALAPFLAAESIRIQ